MRNRYLEANTCYYMSSKQRKRAMRRKIRYACNIIIGVCLFMALGIIGSVDINKISLVEFFVHETINAIILLLAVHVRVTV